MTLAWLTPAAAAEGERVATLRGRVTEARTGTPIATALVAIHSRKLEVTTDAEGRFALPGLPLGDAEIAVTSAGFGLVRKLVRVEAGAAELEIRLEQDALQRTEEIDVETPVFEPVDPAAPLEYGLVPAELGHLASVLADDPLRSVHALPGVASGDDFSATFAARGSGFAAVGFYVDGVLMGSPFHTVRDVNESFSLTILNGDVVQSLSLLSSGAPARYGGRTGAVLSVRTREGNREEFHGRAGLSASGLLATLEGPLGRAKRTSWLVSARKSYADYVLDRIADNPGMVLGYYDATAKLAHQLTASNTLSLLLLHGRSRWRSTEADIDADDLYDADAETDLASLEWSFLPSARSRLEAGVSFLRETGDNRALDGTDLHRSTGTQWALRADATHASGRHRLEAGFLARGVAEAALGRRYDRLARDYRTTVDYDAGGAHWGAYLQDTWTGLDRLSLTLGARFERYAGIAESRFLPRASLSFTLSHRTRAVAAYGSYAQPPGFAQLHGENGNPDLSAEGSRHLSVALERQLSDTFRMRLEAYDLRHSGLFFSRETEWRVEDGRVVPPRRRATLGNALAGSSRGLELLLQRRSSDGLAGWIAYSLGHARRREQGGGLGFDADFDQRHTLTLHASQRLSRTLSLSTKYRYGSGFPVAGFYGADAAGTLLASERNAFRPAAYSRWDARIDKAFLFDGWKLTLYGEVINLLNRTQRRYTGLGSVDSRTRRVSLNDDTLLPLLPSAGLALEF